MNAIIIAAKPEYLFICHYGRTLPEVVAGNPRRPVDVLLRCGMIVSNVDVRTMQVRLWAYGADSTFPVDVVGFRFSLEG